MRKLELLAPARNADIGIAAIDCGADAVYIAGPAFGARQAAGNGVEEIGRLCSYAHRFGAKIFVTLNTILYDTETDSAMELVGQVREAGADALIVQDMAIPMMFRNLRPEERIPLHASTQCAIRTPEQAMFHESLGFSRLILERELSLDDIRRIREAVSCDLEFFVHGALCVCYSGQCYLSQMLAGRSANRGACIQACRSRYDLSDRNGNILAHDRALLSLKDYSLKERLEDLAEAGIMSFKIEGRLKNMSYVKNVVREYSMALDSLVERFPEKYSRASYGRVSEGFAPDPDRTFNRGYTGLFIDGRRGKWNSGDAAKSMGERIGTAIRVSRSGDRLEIRPDNGKRVRLSNGDGFSFVSAKGNVVGFRGDICEGMSVRCKPIPELFEGAVIYRNADMEFERMLDRNRCIRELKVRVSVTCTMDSGGKYTICADAVSEDGRKAHVEYAAGDTAAENTERIESILGSAISKSAGIFRFSTDRIIHSGSLPFIPVSAANAIRRELAERLSETKTGEAEADSCLFPSDEKVREAFLKAFPDRKVTYKANVANSLAERLYMEAGAESVSRAYEISPSDGMELMRTRYCIRYELGMCPKAHGSRTSEDLYLTNNGRRFTLHFDCRNCEMTVCSTNSPQSQK